jgi:hypothetical protein
VSESEIVEERLSSWQAGDLKVPCRDLRRIHGRVVGALLRLDFF